MQVEANHTGNVRRTYKVKSLTPKGADAMMFEMDDGELSVAAYFERKYGTRCAACFDQHAQSGCSTSTSSNCKT